MKRKLSKSVKKAMLDYWAKREASRIAVKSGAWKPGMPKIWDKQACLTAIDIACSKQKAITSFMAIAGTFFLTWKDGKTTQHNEKNWWRMKLYT
jgi:hypothetical protein